MIAIKKDKTTIRRGIWGKEKYLKIYSSELTNVYFECNDMGEYKPDSIIFYLIKKTQKFGYLLRKMYMQMTGKYMLSQLIKVIR